MALQSKTAIGLIFGAAILTAQPTGLRYEVRHKHTHKGAPAVINFNDSRVWFEDKKHAETWKYEDIQRLELAPDKLTILTYEDKKWQLGRDRVYEFDQLPKDMAAQLYANLHARLDQRFVAQVADSFVEPIWQAPAKVLHGWYGAQGTIKVGADRVVFESPQPGDSRTWRYSDVTNFSSAGPYELTLTSLDGSTRFQLKQALPEDRFNDLWRRINQANGLQSFRSQIGDTK
jgi:hypothetical protein